MTHHTCNPNAFYAHNIKMENESPTLVYILFLIIRRLQSIRLRNQRIHRRQILFVFLDRITRRRQWMFLALQQNIMEQRERGIVRRLWILPRPLLRWFDVNWYDQTLVRYRKEPFRMSKDTFYEF